MGEAAWKIRNEKDAKPNLTGTHQDGEDSILPEPPPTGPLRGAGWAENPESVLTVPAPSAHLKSAVENSFPLKI